MFKLRYLLDLHRTVVKRLQERLRTAEAATFRCQFLRFRGRGRRIAVRVQGTSHNCTCDEVFTEFKWMKINIITEFQIGIWSALV